MKNLSWPSFFIGAGAGLLIGVIIIGGLLHYLVSRALSGDEIAGNLFGAPIEQIRGGVEYVQKEKAAVSAYGKVVSIGGGTLVIQAAQSSGPKELTFVYDDNTVFVYLDNDAASTEVPLSSDTIMVGEGLNVLTNEPVGSVENQYAVKIIRI